MIDDRMYNAWALGRLGAGLAVVSVVNKALPAIQRAHEASCSISDDAMRARYEKAGDRAYGKVFAEMVQLGVKVERQTDPRGAPVQVWAKGEEGREEPTYRLGAKGFTAAEMQRIDRMAEKGAAR